MEAEVVAEKILVQLSLNSLVEEVEEEVEGEK